MSTVDTIIRCKERIDGAFTNGLVVWFSSAGSCAAQLSQMTWPSVAIARDSLGKVQI